MRTSFDNEISTAIIDVRRVFRPGDLPKNNIEFTASELASFPLSIKVLRGETLSPDEMDQLRRANATISPKVGMATLRAAQKFMSQHLDKPEPPEQIRAVEHLNRILHEAQQTPDRKAIRKLSHMVERVAALTLILSALWLLLWLGGFLDMLAFIRQRGTLGDVLQQKALEQAQAARAAAETKLSVLAAQVEPHFLFNSLASVRSAAVSDPARATHMIDQLVTYLRSTIPQMRNDVASATVNLASQLASVRSYLALMHERIPRLQFSVESEAGLDTAQLPPLMLISLVENAVKHGVEPKIGAARVDVMARRVEGDAGLQLEVSVVDDGVGFGDTTSGDGIGLANIQERLRTLFGASASLSLKALPGGGVAAILWLPLSLGA